MSDVTRVNVEAGVASRPISIRVIGVGSAGCRVVEHMATCGFAGVAFTAANTDAQALLRCGVADKLILGQKARRGMGAGGDPEQGRAAAETDEPRLRALCEGTDIVFVAAGLGGGTGTGAAPVIARLAREAGALVLGIITLPFECEGGRRVRQAWLGLQHFKEAADAVICVPNQRLFKLMDEHTSLPETFLLINNLLAQGVQGIWRVLTQPGLLRIDFADLCAVTRGRHAESALATAEAMGENRSRELVDRLLEHPLLDSGQALADADAVLVSLVGGTDLTMVEVSRVMEQINRRCERAHVVLGAMIDDAMTNRLSATLLAAYDGTHTAEHGVVPSPGTQETETKRPQSATGSEHGDPPTEGARLRPRTPRIVPPPPDLTPEQAQQLLKWQGGAHRSRKHAPRLRQGFLPLQIVSKGRFEKSEPTVLHGEDLDVPTYIRRGVPLN